MNQRFADLSSAYELAEKGLFAKAADVVDRLDSMPISAQVLRAQLDAHLRSPVMAREKAEVLLKQQLPHKERAECWAIIGSASMRGGQFQYGLKAIDRALESAIATREPLVEARIRARLVASLLHSVGVEAACIEMPKLRQVALHAGDAASLISFHVLAAAINARRGHHPSTTEHLESGSQLLQRFDNIWLQGRLAIVACAASMLQSDYACALKHIEAAYSAARQSGSREILIPAIGNFAILTFAQRRFEEAKELLSELLVEVQESGNTVLGLNVYANSIELALAKGNLEEAGLLDLAASRVVATTEGGTLYHCGYLLAKVRLLYLQGDVRSGLDIAISAIPQIQRVSDVDSLRRMKLLAAEGLSKVGRDLEAAAMLRDTVAEQPNCSIEIVAEASRIAGHLLAAEAPSAARHHLEHAKRLLVNIGNLNASLRVEHGMACGNTEATAVRADASQSITVQGTDSILTMLQMGANPPLLARELLSWIRLSGEFLEASIVKIAPEGKRTAIDDYAAPEALTATAEMREHRHIVLGTHDRHSYELVVSAKPTVQGTLSTVSLNRLATTAISLARAHQMQHEFAAIWPAESTEKQLGLVCSSSRMKELVRTIRQVADSNVTVLITGETGVGKELFARALHSSSPRSSQTLLPFNCSTIPRDLIDSQLFGHKRGAFTGAQHDSLGMIRSAAGGTLFLDEIGEMSLDTQPKLLRFLESGEILPLGDTKSLVVDVRIIAATNANLDQLVADGRFREDLYYRLNVIRIDIPPLRERREEIPALIEHFVQRFGQEFDKPMLRVADDTLEYLVLYRWPGNVRQLANEIRRLVAMAEPGSVIMPAHLAGDIVESRRTLPANRSPRLFSEVITRIDQPLSAAVEHIERAAIQRALSMTDGRLDEAAKMLGRPGKAYISNDNA